MEEINITSAYENLANAIVVLAIEDYIKAKRRLLINGNDFKNKIVKEECERFFNSKYFALLTNIDIEYVLKELEKK